MGNILFTRNSCNALLICYARAAALFILNGEIGLINDSEMNSDQKLEILKEFVLKVLK